MDSASFLPCCLSRKDKKPQTDKTIEANDEFLREKIQKKSAYIEEDINLGKDTTSTSPVRTHKQPRLTMSEKRGIESEGRGRLTAYKIDSTDDSLNGEGLENIVEDLKMKVYTHAQWMKILKNDDLENTSMTEVIHSLRHGVKNELRPLIWDFLTKINELKKQHPSDYYKKLKGTASSVDQQIRTAASQTFPEHQFFTDESTQAETLLFNVLRAYANHDKETGFVQGMNFIVGKLLIILEPDNFGDSELSYYQNFDQDYEEKVFWIFVHISSVLNWRQVYKSNSSKTQGLLAAFDSRLKIKAPEIYNILKAKKLDITKCFQSMFSCICMENAPISITKRFFDLFFIEEEKILFKMLIRAMMLCKKEITEASKSGNLEGFFKNDLLEVCGHKYRTNLYVVFPGTESFD